VIRASVAVEVEPRFIISKHVKVVHREQDKHHDQYYRHRAHEGTPEKAQHGHGHTGGENFVLRKKEEKIMKK